MQLWSTCDVLKSYYGDINLSLTENHSSCTKTMANTDSSAYSQVFYGLIILETWSACNLLFASKNLKKSKK